MFSQHFPRWPSPRSELDERFLESRRRTILREHQQLLGRPRGNFCSTSSTSKTWRLYRQSWQSMQHDRIAITCWLVVWNIFYYFSVYIYIYIYILGTIIPTDFHIFQRGWNHQPECNNHEWANGWPVPPLAEFLARTDLNLRKARVYPRVTGSWVSGWSHLTWNPPCTLWEADIAMENGWTWPVFRYLPIQNGHVPSLLLC